MKTILITAIGGDIAQAAASIIRSSYPDWKIVGIDTAHRHGGMLFVDKFDLALPARAPEYLAWLTAYINSLGVDYCLPMSEMELTVMAEAGLLDKIGKAELLWAGSKAVSIGCDKLETAHFIRNCGLPGPWTYSADECHPGLSYPCIFKLRRGAGSKAVFLCASDIELDFFRHRYPEAVVQEFLPDAEQEITCAVYRTWDKEVRVLAMLRRLTGGFTGWAQIIVNSEVEAQCTRIAEALGLHGSINVQLRLTRNGPRIFEINPRFSSTVLMRHIAGYTDLEWLIEEAEGRSTKFNKPPEGMILIRTQGAALLPE